MGRGKKRAGDRTEPIGVLTSIPLSEHIRNRVMPEASKEARAAAVLEENAYRLSHCSVCSTEVDHEGRDDLPLSWVDSKGEVYCPEHYPVSEEQKQQLTDALTEAGCQPDDLDARQQAELEAIWQERRAHALDTPDQQIEATVVEFSEWLEETEEETEPCDRCAKLVRAGYGSYWPEEDLDQERLCLDCFDQAKAAAPVAPAA